jgi:hypothetical protein
MQENRIAPAPPEALPQATTPAETNPRLAAAMATLEQGIESVLSDQGFASYLRMLSKFHEYSWANTILIMSQKPDATRVNSYDRWQQLGRQVMKGEHGIKIFYPKKRKQADPDTGEESVFVTGFGIGNVFDISQTEGDPLPTPPTVADLHDTDEKSRQVNIRLSRWLKDSEGLRLESKDFPGAAKGFYLPTSKPPAIVIRKDIDIKNDGEIVLVDPLSVGKTKTLVHEAAHYVADHRGDLPKEDAETVAEASAFAVMQNYGLDTGGYSFPYIATWAKNRDVLKRNLGQVQRVSHVLITAIEGTPFHEPQEQRARFPEEDERLALREQLIWQGDLRAGGTEGHE